MDTIFGIDIVDLNCAWILSDATSRCCYKLSTTEVTVDLSQSASVRRFHQLSCRSYDSFTYCAYRRTFPGAHLSNTLGQYHCHACAP